MRHYAEDLITNNAFGGPDMKTLYVTAGKTLYKGADGHRWAASIATAMFPGLADEPLEPSSPWRMIACG